jgi:hypothetical protein
MSKKTVLFALAALVPATALAATPFRTSIRTSHVAVTQGGDVPVAGASRTGSLRTHYIVPANWRRDSGLGRVMRFDTHNSCHHKVTFTPRLVQAEDVPATERAESLVPGSNPYAYGTREGAAFRVRRQRGSATVVGVLVQPLSQRYASAPGQRVYAELRATATADPKLECHSGGPRTVGDAIGDAFAAGQVGGFVSSNS